MSGDQQFVDGLTDRHAIADDENARHRRAASDSRIGERGNGSAVMGQQNQAVGGGPFKHGGIVRFRQANVANVNELQRWIAASHAIHHVLVEILVDQKRDHSTNPFALARAKSSSLVGPGGCAASMVRRVASACSSHCRRYASKGTGSARYRLMTAYTSARRSDGVDSDTRPSPRTSPNTSLSVISPCTYPSNDDLATPNISSSAATRVLRGRRTEAESCHTPCARMIPWIAASASRRHSPATICACSTRTCAMGAVTAVTSPMISS